MPEEVKKKVEQVGDRKTVELRRVGGTACCPMPVGILTEQGWSRTEKVRVTSLPKGKGVLIQKV